MKHTLIPGHIHVTGTQVAAVLGVLLVVAAWRWLTGRSASPAPRSAPAESASGGWGAVFAVLGLLGVAAWKLDPKIVHTVINHYTTVRPAPTPKTVHHPVAHAATAAGHSLLSGGWLALIVFIVAGAVVAIVINTNRRAED